MRGVLWTVRTGHYVFQVRTETGQRRRYGFRLDDARITAYLDKLPNRSEFFRRVIENEIIGRSAVAAPAHEDGEMVERLARLERGIETLSADMKRVLNELRAMATSGRPQPPPAEAPEQPHDSDLPEGNHTPEEQAVLDQLLSAMLNFGQPKGGDQA